MTGDTERTIVETSGVAPPLAGCGKTLVHGVSEALLG